jgi:phage repressor protein C with HTH and peptisase S24 domain
MQGINESFLAAVDSLVKLHGLKYKEIAAAVGVRPTYFSQLMNGRAPSEKLAKAVQLLVFQKNSQSKTSGAAASPVPEPEPAKAAAHRVPVVAWAVATALLDHYGGNFSDLANQLDETVGTDCKDPNAYALIIEGDSMEPRFCAGDRVIVAPNFEPRNGDYVVARLRETGQVLFKRFRRTGTEGKVIRLESLNPAYGPVEFPEDAFRLIHPVVDAKMNLKR